MEASSCILLSPSSPFPTSCLVIVLKYSSLMDIINKLMCLNRNVRERVGQENYILFKHFLHLFNLHDRLKRSDILTRVDILELIKNNLKAIKT